MSIDLYDYARCVRFLMESCEKLEQARMQINGNSGDYILFTHLGKKIVEIETIVEEMMKQPKWKE